MLTTRPFFFLNFEFEWYIIELSSFELYVIELIIILVHCQVHIIPFYFWLRQVHIILNVVN